MNCISLSRLKMLFVHDLTTYSKEKIYLAVLVFFPALISFIIKGFMPGMAIMLLIISLVTAVLAPYYFASHICANMRTKQDAIAFAMIPATNVEKFIVRLVDYAILPVAIVTVATLAIMLIVGCAISIGNYEEIKMIVTMITNEDIFENFDWGWVFSFDAFTLFCGCLTNVIFDVSLVVLGGCFFKRFALVKTWLILVAASVTLSGFLGNLDLDIMERLFDSTGTMWAGMFLLDLLTAGILYLSYLLFKRKQIV